jgi:hypothetical protein
LRREERDFVPSGCPKPRDRACHPEGAPRGIVRYAIVCARPKDLVSRAAGRVPRAESLPTVMPARSFGRRQRESYQQIRRGAALRVTTRLRSGCSRTREAGSGHGASLSVLPARSFVRRAESIVREGPARRLLRKTSWRGSAAFLRYLLLLSSALLRSSPPHSSAFPTASRFPPLPLLRVLRALRVRPISSPCPPCPPCETNQFSTLLRFSSAFRSPCAPRPPRETNQFSVAGRTKPGGAQLVTVGAISLPSGRMGRLVRRLKP